MILKALTYFILQLMTYAGCTKYNFDDAPSGDDANATMLTTHFVEDDKEFFFAQVRNCFN